jgi:hypothetical protein
MHPLLGLTVQNGYRLEEIAAALVAAGGAYWAYASSMQRGRHGIRWLPGALFALAGVLAVIGLHWGIRH